MQNLALFIPAHWLLIFSFTVVLLLLIGNEIMGRLSAAPLFTAEKLVLAINRDQAICVDLRDAASFKKGHVMGAINIPLETLSNADAKLERHKEKILVLSCAQGQHSAKAAKGLKAKGFNVAILKSGLTGWRNANMPLAKN